MLVVGCPTTHDVDEFVTREHRPKLLAELNETTSRVWRAEWGVGRSRDEDMSSM